MTTAVPFVGGSFDRCVRTETSGRAPGERALSTTWVVDRDAA